MDPYNHLWGLPPSHDVLPPQPCSLDLDNVNVLTSRPYMVSFKTDGVRRVLYAHHEVIFWVDRNGERKVVAGSAAHNVYAGTILDGEFLDNRFVVFDCVALTGTPVYRQSLSHRLMHAVTACKLIKLDNIAMEVKPTVCATNLGRLLKLKGKYNNDGLIFTPHNKTIDTGTAKDTLKWKFTHTVDLWMCLTNEYLQFSLYTQDGYEINRVRFEENDPLGVITSNRLVECEWKSGNFVPVRVGNMIKTRSDKPRANSHYVVKRTVKAIKDNITIDDLLKLRYKSC